MGQCVGAAYSPPASPQGGMAASLIRFREPPKQTQTGAKREPIGPRLKGIVCASTSGERFRACNGKRECGSCYRPVEFDAPSLSKLLPANPYRKARRRGKAASPNYFPPFWIAVSQRYKQTLLRKSGRTCLLVSLILVSANHR